MAWARQSRARLFVGSAGRKVSRLGCSGSRVVLYRLVSYVAVQRSSARVLLLNEVKSPHMLVDICQMGWFVGEVGSWWTSKAQEEFALRSEVAWEEAGPLNEHGRLDALIDALLGGRWRPIWGSSRSYITPISCVSEGCDRLRKGQAPPALLRTALEQCCTLGHSLTIC